MSIRMAIDDRLIAAARDGDGLRLALPRALRTDDTGARVGILKRLSGSRTFALGDRTGVLRAAQNRSGRPFRLDVRQRVIVKALVSRHAGRGAERAAALCKHVIYLGRQGAGVDGAEAEFFDREQDGLDPKTLTQDWGEDRHHFRFIISPEHGDRLDLQPYVRDVMGRVAADLGEPGLAWLATCHYDTDQPHAHVLVRGLRGDGRDLVIPRDYMGYGFSGRGLRRSPRSGLETCRGSRQSDAFGRKPRPTDSPDSIAGLSARSTETVWSTTASEARMPGRR